MKKIVIIFIFILYYNSFSQNLDSIVKKDTLYICFDYGKNQEVKKVEQKHPKLGQRVRYYFRFGKKFIVLTKQNYIDFDAIDNNKKTDVLKVSKSFLRENKDIIINYKFLKKQKNLRSIYLNELRYKTFYLIDKKEFKNNMIVLREVRFDSNFYANE